MYRFRVSKRIVTVFFYFIFKFVFYRFRVRRRLPQVRQY